MPNKRPLAITPPWTDLQALAWLLDFCQEPVESLQNFDLAPGLEYLIGTYPAEPGAPPRKGSIRIADLQAVVRKLIVDLLDQGYWFGQLDLAYAMAPEADGSVRREPAGGRVDHALLERTMGIVERVGLSRIRRCLVCKRLMVAQREKDFCSNRCQMKDYMRAYRARDYEAPPKRKKGQHYGKKQTRTRGR